DHADHYSPSRRIKSVSFFIFFFQAEDGIRDFHVTGVQTCALPISELPARSTGNRHRRAPRGGAGGRPHPVPAGAGDGRPAVRPRSEERRVGKEWGGRWAPQHETKEAEEERNLVQ